MWYAAVNLGYANAAVAKALRAQIDKLPQLACQYLHREKIELAQAICESIERAFGIKGRVQFNVGGSQAIEDALKLVRKATGRSRMLAFQGGYHGRTLGASAITSSYRYREAFGEFADRAEFIPFPYPFRSPHRGDAQQTEDDCIAEFERRFEHEYTGTWNPKTGRSEFGAIFVEAVQGTGGYVIPPKNYFRRLAAICRKHGILVVDDALHVLLQHSRHRHGTRGDAHPRARRLRELGDAQRRLLPGEAARAAREASRDRRSRRLGARATHGNVRGGRLHAEPAPRRSHVPARPRGRSRDRLAHPGTRAGYRLLLQERNHPCASARDHHRCD